MLTSTFKCVFLTLFVCALIGCEETLNVANDASLQDEGDATTEPGGGGRTDSTPRPDFPPNPPMPGDDDGEEESNEPPPECSDGAKAWRAAALSFDEQYGFNLDNHQTLEHGASIPEEGCGIPDGLDGRDAAFNELLKMLGPLEPDLDIPAGIAHAISTGALEILIYIRGYSIDGENDDIRLTLVVNGVRHPGATDLHATLENETFHVSFETLPLHLNGIQVIPFGDPVVVDLPINLSGGRLELPAPQISGSTYMTLGARMLYQGEDGVKSHLQTFVMDILGISDDIDPMMANYIDMSSDGVACDSISLGAQLRLIYDDICDV